MQAGQGQQPQQQAQSQSQQPQQQPQPLQPLQLHHSSVRVGKAEEIKSVRPHPKGQEPRSRLRDALKENAGNAVGSPVAVTRMMRASQSPRANGTRHSPGELEVACDER